MTLEKTRLWSACSCVSVGVMRRGEGSNAPTPSVGKLSPILRPLGPADLKSNPDPVGISFNSPVASIFESSTGVWFDCRRYQRSAEIAEV